MVSALMGTADMAYGAWFEKLTKLESFCTVKVCRALLHCST